MIRLKITQSLTRQTWQKTQTRPSESAKQKRPSIEAKQAPPKNCGAFLSGHRPQATRLRRGAEQADFTRKTWSKSWNKRGTEQVGTGSNTGYEGPAKSLRSKDGLSFFSAHNPKVGGSNPPPATNSTVWFQWVEPILTMGSVTLNPDSQPKFPRFFTQTPVEGTVWFESDFSTAHGALNTPALFHCSVRPQ
jgi:hypothetical protein